MRKVDPAIKLGAVVSTGLQDLAGWPTGVALGIGSKMDFAIFHCYLPNLWQTKGPAPAEICADGLAGFDQIQSYLDNLKALLAKGTNNAVTPIAVTEYNGGFVQEEPTSYRHSLLNALVVADMLRIWLRPENHILMANFWEFPNEYWGAVKGYPQLGQSAVCRPQYFPFALYHAHFGVQLLNAKVDCQSYDTDGNMALGIEPHSGVGSDQREYPPIHLEPTWEISPISEVSQTIEGGNVLRVDFRGESDLNYYHAKLWMPVQPRTWYRVRGMIKTENLTTENGACFQISDDRGWPVTHSAAITPDVRGTKGWTQVEGLYQTLPDSKGVDILARRLSDRGVIHGTAWFKDLSISRFVPHAYPAVPLIAATASISEDRHTLYVMITNKDQARSIPIQLKLKNAVAKSARAWTLAGPSVDSTNEVDADNVGIRPLPATARGLTVPRHSLTAVEIKL